MKKIEELNTLVFIVDTRASKRHIKDAIASMYDVTAQKVITLLKVTYSARIVLQFSSFIWKVQTFEVLQHLQIGNDLISSLLQNGLANWHSAIWS